MKTTMGVSVYIMLYTVALLGHCRGNSESRDSIHGFQENRSILSSSGIWKRGHHSF